MTEEELRLSDKKQLLKEVNELHDNTIGCYALMEYEVVLYVGKADCLKKRLKTHLRKRSDLTTIKIFFLPESALKLSFQGIKDYLRYLEACLIKNLDPIENKKRPSVTLEYICKMSTDARRLIIESIP